MNESLGKRTARKGVYGIDAPYLLPIPLALMAWNIAQGVYTRTPWPFAAAILMAACLALGWHASRRGKFIVWIELLDQLQLRGDERILDIGCGRGAVLMLAAQHLTTGQAVGVDLWRRRDQSGNSCDATKQNAVAENVADRVEVHLSDMTSLPFPDDSFAVVVSNIAIHNVKDHFGRKEALRQAARVLQPGGRLMIADIWYTGAYIAYLKELGMEKVARRNLGWRMWWSGPWLATRLLTAIKPSSSAAHAARVTV